VINAIVYGEIAFAADRIEVVDELLPSHLYDCRAIPREAAFLAARAHAEYRSRGGSRQSILPDFLIGSHALVERLPLLTRDERRYRRAFPGLRLIAPEGPLQLSPSSGTSSCNASPGFSVSVVPVPPASSGLS